MTRAREAFVRAQSALYLAVLCLGCWSLGAQQGEPDADAEAPPLVVTYLANEGVLLARGDTKAVIDAFLKTPLGSYAALSEATRGKMLAGTPPFDGVDLALASHVHPDHIQPELAREVLGANAAWRFASSPQVAEALLEGVGAEDALRKRVESFLPEAGAWSEIESGGVRVRTFRLPHAGNRPAVQNLGQWVDLDGLHVLHLGDGDLTLDNLRDFHLNKQEVDVALVPYWWLLDEKGTGLVRATIAPRVLVAIHVPPKDAGAVVTALKRTAPEAVVFDVELESIRVAPR